MIDLLFWGTVAAWFAHLALTVWAVWSNVQNTRYLNKLNGRLTSLEHRSRG